MSKPCQLNTKTLSILHFFCCPAFDKVHANSQVLCPLRPPLAYLVFVLFETRGRVNDWQVEALQSCFLEICRATWTIQSCKAPPLESTMTITILVTIRNHKVKDFPLVRIAHRTNASLLLSNQLWTLLVKAQHTEGW